MYLCRFYINRHDAQVVGSKMPRYRLFGETIDLAAMMNIMGEGRAKKEKVNESRLAKYLKGVTWGGGG